MQLGESLNLALSAIRANKMRSVLTLLGIIIGVMTIIAMQSLVTGLQKSVHEQLTMLAPNVFQAQKFPAVIQGDWEKYANRRDLTIAHANLVRERVTDAIKVGAEVWTGGEELRYRDEKTNPSMTVAGATPEFIDNNGYEISEGRFLIQEDVDFARSVCVIGLDIVNALFPFENPLGKEIKLRGERFEVVGVFMPMGNIFGRSQDDRMVIPITRFEKLFGKYRSIHITVQAKNAAVYDEVMDQTIGVLRIARNLKPGQENDFDIRTNESLTGFFDNLTKYVRIVAIAIASISLLVAGVGIMNIMLVSVTERTREIGIRKSIGAKRRDILWQFMIEAIVLSEFGGVIGILIGLLIGKLVDLATPVPAAIPVWTVILGLVFCSFVGIIFGVYPATKAARLDPIHALRYE